MKSTLLTVSFGFIFTLGFSQVGINTSTPLTTLDIRAINHLGSASPEDGLLVPRVSDLSNDGMVSGQLLFLIADWTDDNGTPSDTSDDILLSKGFHFWDADSTSWADVGVASAAIQNSTMEGDIKHGFQNTDHSGWYLLDGRTVASLPSNAQTAASSLGFTTSLPNATNRVLKAKSGSEALGAQTGNNAITLAASNIPQLTGTTNTSGSHDHQYEDWVAEFTSFSVKTGGSSTGSRFSFYQPYVDTTEASGDHNHALTVGNAAPTAVDATPASLVTNVFVYLGN